MKAIVPTGGHGTRMQPITYSINKHFIPVANKPLIYYPIETLAAAGIKEIAVTFNPGWLDLVQDYLGDGGRWGVKFTYILQPEPLGLANIFQVCEHFLAGSDFVLHLGDNIFVDGINEAVSYFEKKKPNGLVLMLHHTDNRRMGVPYFDKSGKLIKYVEKPENPPHDFAVPGLYFFDKTIFKCFTGKDKIQPSARGELEISSAYQWLIDHKFHVDVLEYRGKWLDPGKIDDWLTTNQYLLSKRLEPEVESELGEGTIIEHEVRIGKGCKIDNSRIRGPVVIGDNVSISGSFVGPFTSIGDNCVLEDCQVENSVIMKGVKIIKVQERIDGSLIGSKSEITNNVVGSLLSLFVGENSKIRI